MAPCSLYVKGLPPDITEQFLYKTFSPHGPLHSCKVKRDPSTGQCSGVAFINFQNHDHAMQALQALDGAPLTDGGRLHVQMQAPRSHRAATAAVYRAALDSGPALGTVAPTARTHLAAGLTLHAHAHALAPSSTNTQQQVTWVTHPNPNPNAMSMLLGSSTSSLPGSSCMAGAEQQNAAAQQLNAALMAAGGYYILPAGGGGGGQGGAGVGNLVLVGPGAPHAHVHAHALTPQHLAQFDGGAGLSTLGRFQ